MQANFFSKSKMIPDMKIRTKRTRISMKLGDYPVGWLLGLRLKYQTNASTLSMLKRLSKITQLFQLSSIQDLITH